MMMFAAFHQFTLELETNLFHELLEPTAFEPVAKGRLGNHLVKSGEKGIPIVRTTTKYNIPAQPFAAIHQRIADGIEQPDISFNNALIEVYDASYTKMNYHSDQSLDLEDDSWIAVFSCYENPDMLSEQQIRKLKIRDKVSNEETEYALLHNSVVLFSTATNKKFQHKIVLAPVLHTKPPVSGNRWLGMTLRKSKTFIRFEDNVPHFSNGIKLELANKEQETEFYRLRGEENRGLDFVYPELIYTVNMADRMIPGNNC